jgi:parallel beta-helix repeat protein
MISKTKISKTKRTGVFLSLALVLAICFAAHTALASTVEVGSCVSAPLHFATIQAALNAAPAGSRVEVCPGTYNEQLVITKAVTLTGIQSGTGDAAVLLPPAAGLSANATDIFGGSVAAQIFVNNAGGDVTIERLTIDGTGNNIAGCGPTLLQGIYYQNTSGTITNNVVRNQYETDYAVYGGCQNGFAINVESTGSSNTITISTNSVRAYQKNGITASGAGTGAGSPGPSVTISSNHIVGLAATAMNWQGVYSGEATAAENGIQVGYGATGTVETNVVNDNIWGQDTSSDTGDAASGILIFASPNIALTGNQVGSAQFGIALETDSTGFCGTSSAPISCGTADGATVTMNKVEGTQLFDGIDACSNSNTIESNTMYGNTESGVHLDDSCTSSTVGTTSGNNNTVSKNLVLEACAGILLGTGTGNTTTPNTLFDVTNTTLSGDVCPAAADAAVRKLSSKARVSPYRPTRR